MKSEAPVLALYPYTYGLGYVLATDPGELLYYGTAYIYPFSCHKHIWRFEKLLDEFQPQVVIMRGYDKKKGSISARVKRTINTLERYAEEKGLTVFKYDHSQVKDVFSQFKCRNKCQIAKKIVEFLPELEHRLPEDRRYPDPKPYGMTLFDTVSLLLTHYYLKD